MSLINQVLQDLDKRGAGANIDEASIRVVHARSERSAFRLIAAGAAGMLGLGAAAWFIWEAQQRAPAPPVAAALITPVPVALQAASQALAVAAQAASQPSAAIAQNTAAGQNAAARQSVVPLIASVSPDPVTATAAAQILTIKGGNFAKDATVTLRNSAGRAYPNRRIREQTPEQIVIKHKFGSLPATPGSAAWMVEVNNADGSSSAPYRFTVQALSPVNPAQAAASPAMHPATAAPTTVLPGGVHKRATQLSVQQQAENEFRRAYQLMRQGRSTEALAGYESALRLDPGHDMARQSMVSLLLEKKRNADAERVLQEGLKNNLQQSSFAMLLARLQVERNALPQALDTLQNSMPYAEKRADYQAFVAALLQRQNQHEEAVAHYQAALQLTPNNGVWLMGLGISMQSLKRDAEARAAYRRALETHSLNNELQEFVERRLKDL